MFYDDSTFLLFSLQIIMQVKRLLLKMLKLAYQRLRAAQLDGKTVNVEVASDGKKISSPCECKTGSAVVRNQSDPLN